MRRNRRTSFECPTISPTLRKHDALLMRSAHPLIANPFFQFEKVEEVIRALSGWCGEASAAAITELGQRNLPPVISPEAMAVMLGVNPGFIWSLTHRTSRHYRVFEIRTGKKSRTISAPKVALKLIQRWLAYHWQRQFRVPEHVFGFVPGRNHIDAASVHVGAQWICSLDVADFFPTTPQNLVQGSLVNLGYPDRGAKLLSSLTCLDGFLPQGAPTSPVLSNMVFSSFDNHLSALADSVGANLSRYADDIVFSGRGEPPENLLNSARQIICQGPWSLCERKVELVRAPARLKVHGLLVHGDAVRLTKGYRNRLRAYGHLMKLGKIDSDDLEMVKGHLEYSKLIERYRSS